MLFLFSDESKNRSANELITFAAVCQSAPMAYAATSGQFRQLQWDCGCLILSISAAPFLLSSYVNQKPVLLVPGIVALSIATGTVATLYWLN